MFKCHTCGSIINTLTPRKRGKGILDLQVSEILKGKQKLIRMTDIVDYVNEDNPEFRPACARSIRETPAWIRYNKRMKGVR
jgi:hypothetical protein